MGALRAKAARLEKALQRALERNRKLRFSVRGRVMLENFRLKAALRQARRAIRRALEEVSPYPNFPGGCFGLTGDNVSEMKAALRTKRAKP